MLHDNILGRIDILSTFYKTDMVSLDTLEFRMGARSFFVSYNNSSRSESLNDHIL